MVIGTRKPAGLRPTESIADLKPTQTAQTPLGNLVRISGPDSPTAIVCSQ
jgi:hypothetical protein